VNTDKNQGDSFLCDRKGKGFFVCNRINDRVMRYDILERGSPDDGGKTNARMSRTALLALMLIGIVWANESPSWPTMNTVLSGPTTSDEELRR
jgi:hypothetical protein